MVHYIQLVEYQDDGQSTEEEESEISCRTNVVESEIETGIGVQVTEVYRTEAVLDMAGMALSSILGMCKSEWQP